MNKTDTETHIGSKYHFKEKTMKEFKREIRIYCALCDSLANKQLSVFFRKERDDYINSISVNFKIVNNKIHVEVKDKDIKRVFDMNDDYVTDIADLLKGYSYEYKERQTWSRHLNRHFGRPF